MDDQKRMDRREAIKWILAAGATLSVVSANGFAGAGSASGYGTDPNLLEAYKPGNFWPLTLTKEQHQTVSALCDVILPADDRSPSASEVKVPDFLDEWISAPYVQQRSDRQTILDGIVWLDGESKRRFSKPFHELDVPQQNQICDDICSSQKAAPNFLTAARFFAKFRDLAVGAFFSSPQGMKDIQYLGNVPLTKFDGPTPEVLAYLKL